MDWSIDGKKYKYSDMVPIGCNDCEGCSSCCHMMGDTIIQDPYDMWLFCSNMRLAGGVEVSFEVLISEDGPWELSVQDGLILPNLKMVEDGRCPFLTGAGRCGIHKIRSGLCRLFPLARVFEENQTVSYTILNKELGCEKINYVNHNEAENSRLGNSSNCKATGEDIVVADWLGYEDIENYERYIYSWHEIKKEVTAAIQKRQSTQLTQEAQSGQLQAEFLEHFYVKKYQAGNSREFMTEFENRVLEWNKQSHE